MVNDLNKPLEPISKDTKELNKSFIKVWKYLIKNNPKSELKVFEGEAFLLGIENIEMNKLMTLVPKYFETQYSSTLKVLKIFQKEETRSVV